MVILVVFNSFNVVKNLKKPDLERVKKPNLKLNELHLKLKMDIILNFEQGTMKLLGNTESKITKDKNGEQVSHLEVAELVIVHCNTINNNYQRDSRILYTFVPNKPFGSLLEI